MAPRRTLILAVVGWIAGVLLLCSPGVAGADDGYREKPISGFDQITGLEVSEAHGRVVIAGDDRVEIHRLDDFSLVASIPGIYGAADPRIFESSVFVVGADDGKITEIALSDGSTLEQWSTSLTWVSSVAVTADDVWFTHGHDQFTGGVGRIDRSTGAIDQIILPSYYYRGALVRVSPSRPDEIFVGLRGLSPTSVRRFRVDGTTATPLATTPHGPAGSNLGAFEVSADGKRVWLASGSPYRLVELDAETLQNTATVYDGENYPRDVAVADGNDALVLLANGTGSPQQLWLFDRDTPTARHVFPYAGDLGATALTTSDVFVIATERGQSLLQMWPLDYEPVDKVVEVVVLGHGRSSSRHTTFDLYCNVFLGEFSATYGEAYSVTVPADSTWCTLHSQGVRSQATLIELWNGSEWEINETTSFNFDVRVDTRLAVVHLYSSPVNDLDLFIEQTYVDVLGRAPSTGEAVQARDAMVSGRQTPTGFVLSVIDGPGGYLDLREPVSRLYRAFFLREPDPQGIEYWVGLRREGLSLPEIAEQFAVSEEFRLRYGNLSRNDFVGLVYQNVLGRYPDQAGYGYWLAEMDRGLSRGGVMTWFSEGSEYGATQNGRLFVDYVIRTLERAVPVGSDMTELLPIYQRGGRALVVDVVLDGGPYFARFWIDSGSGSPALARTTPSEPAMACVSRVEASRLEPVTPTVSLLDCGS